MTSTQRADAVLFDIDGTLVDSNYVHVTTWAKAFTEAGESVDSWRIHRSIGMDGSLLLDTLIPDADDDDVIQRAKDLHSRYYKEETTALRALTGTHALLEAVARRHLQVVLATSAPEDELSILREVLQIEDIVSTVTSDQDVETAKPQPDIVQVALERSGVTAAHTVFVGDTEWDAKACERAGVPFVGVLTGGISRAELINAGAVAVFDNPADLLDRIDDSPISRLSGQKGIDNGHRPPRP